MPHKDTISSLNTCEREEPIKISTITVRFNDTKIGCTKFLEYSNFNRNLMLEEMFISKILSWQVSSFEKMSS
jgi:hypothetical protein